MAVAPAPVASVQGAGVKFIGPMSAVSSPPPLSAASASSSSSHHVHPVPVTTDGPPLKLVTHKSHVLEFQNTYVAFRPLAKCPFISPPDGEPTLTYAYLSSRTWMGEWKDGVGSLVGPMILLSCLKSSEAVAQMCEITDETLAFGGSTGTIRDRSRLLLCVGLLC
jgi:hypothetical protein